MSFFFTDTPATTIYTLSLHDALPICAVRREPAHPRDVQDRHPGPALRILVGAREDRKSTRLNSSHRCISYAVFCLKKKKRSHRTRRAPSIHTRTPLPPLTTANRRPLL